MNSICKTLLAATALSLVSLSGAWAEMVLNRGQSGDPESLDPQKTSTVIEAAIMRDLFVGLMTQDAAANAIPGAAESYSVSPDGKVYTFKLRPDGKWSDGTPVTADDFVLGLRRLADPATASEYAGLASVIVNGDDVTAGKKKPEELGVRATDPMTVEVTLNAPTPYFLEMLTHQSFSPVNVASFKKEGAGFSKAGTLVSNGAYKVVEFVPGDHLKAVKNPNFYDAANVKIDTVNFYPIEDRAAAMKRFEAGEIDLYDDIPTEQMKELKTRFGDQLKLGPQLGTYYYALKTDKAPWSNVKLRQAISMAIDRDALAEQVWKNAMIPAWSLVPPGLTGYTAKPLDYAEKSQLDREDDAKKILTELGYGPDHPLKMEVRFNAGENHQNTAVAIQEQLKPLGIEITLMPTDMKTHYAHLKNKGDYDAARAGWVADYKDPGSFLDLCKTGNGLNHGNYSNPDYDALLAKAAVNPDPAQRMDLLSQAEAMGVERDLCVIPLMFYSNHDIVSSKVSGFTDNQMMAHPSRFMNKQ